MPIRGMEDIFFEVILKRQKGINKINTIPILNDAIRIGGRVV
jgi:hypothetical protein